MPITARGINICTYEQCSPCISKVYNGKYNCNDIKCMNNITPDMVLKHIKEILK